MSDSTIALAISAIVAVATATIGVGFRGQIGMLNTRIAVLEQTLIDHGIPLPGTSNPTPPTQPQP